MVLEKQFINADMFLDYVEQIDDRIVELVEGVIVDMSRPGWEHGEILITLGALIRDHARKYDLGRVAGGDAGFVLERRADGKDTVRGLDIAFVSKEKPQERLARGWTTIAPDLAVEIISPSNRAEDIEKKIEQLFDAGISLIWVVYPELRTVKVHTTHDARTLGQDDTLTGGDILPGFEIRVAEIFPS